MPKLYESLMNTYKFGRFLFFYRDGDHGIALIVFTFFFDVIAAFENGVFHRSPADQAALLVPQIQHFA